VSPAPSRGTLSASAAVTSPRAECRAESSRHDPPSPRTVAGTRATAHGARIAQRTGSGGAQQDSDSFNFDVQTPNQDPVVTVPGTNIPVVQGGTTVVTGLDVSDADSAAADIVVTLDVTGGTLWVVSIVTAGYLFGNLEWVQRNMSTIIWAMIIVPGLLALLGAWRARRTKGASAPAS